MISEAVLLRFHLYLYHIYFMCIKYKKEMCIKSKHANNILTLDNADQISVGDEVLVQGYDKLIPTKVMNTFDVMLQGICCYLKVLFP